MDVDESWEKEIESWVEGIPEGPMSWAADSARALGEFEFGGSGRGRGKGRGRERSRTTCLIKWYWDAGNLCV